MRVLRLEELPPLDMGGVGYRLVRRELGVRSFGMNGFTADAGEHLIEEHDELANGHEEVYVVLSGRARFTVDGEDAEIAAGTLVSVPDPASKRTAVALEDGTSALALGGKPGEAYEVSAWEEMLALTPLAPDAAADGAADVVARHPENGAALYDLACFEALAGRGDAAVAHLREAIEHEPRALEWARGDSDLDSVRDRPDFPAS